MSWLQALQGVGSAVQAGGALAHGYAGSRVSEYNARVSEIEAGEAVRQGNAEAARLASEGKALQSKQRAQLGASGLDVASPSAMDLYLDSIASNLQDISVVQNKATWRSWALMEDAKLKRRTAKQSILGGWLGAGNAAYRGVANLSIARTGTPLTTPARSTGMQWWDE
jgi:hypothetical protein